MEAGSWDSDELGLTRSLHAGPGAEPLLSCRPALAHLLVPDNPAAYGNPTLQGAENAARSRSGRTGGTPYPARRGRASTLRTPLRRHAAASPILPSRDRRTRGWEHPRLTCRTSPYKPLCPPSRHTPRQLGLLSAHDGWVQGGRHRLGKAQRLPRRIGRLSPWIYGPVCTRGAGNKHICACEREQASGGGRDHTPRRPGGGTRLVSPLPTALAQGQAHCCKVSLLVVLSLQY